MEDEGTILHRMHRLTDYYDIHKEIGRSDTLPKGQSCLYFHYYKRMLYIFDLRSL